MKNTNNINKHTIPLYNPSSAFYTTFRAGYIRNFLYVDFKSAMVNSESCKKSIKKLYKSYKELYKSINKLYKIYKKL